MPWHCGAGTTGPRFMGLKFPTWMPTGRWYWTISYRAGSKRGQLPGSCTPSIPQMRECSSRRTPSKGESTRSKTPSNLCRQQRESERTTSSTFRSTTSTPAKGRSRIQRRLERLEWMYFEDKCNRLDALYCSSTLVSVFTRVLVSCADI